LRILVKSVTKHELVIDDEGLTSSGQYYNAIPDTLNDPTADDYEKTRTIVEIMKGSCPDSSKSEYGVYVFSDQGVLTFTGYM